MKIFAISDLHLSTVAPKPMDVFGGGWANYWQQIVENWNDLVSDDDLVLIPGDISWALKIEDALQDLLLIGALKGKKVILRGNHDYWWNTISQVRRLLPEGMFALQNDCLRFENFIICGSRGWTCPENSSFSEQDQKIYDREVLRLKLSFEAVAKIRKEEDTVVCMMHYPPFNVRREDSEFTKLFIQNRVDSVVYGHLHGKDCRSDLLFQKFGINFYLTSTDLVGHKLTQIL